MKVRDLISILFEADPNAEVCYRDPNFGCPYHEPFTKYCVELKDGKVLISFPFETPVE